MNYNLIPYQDCHYQVFANIVIAASHTLLSFEIEDSEGLELSPLTSSPSYTEGLWNKTCFEFFYNKIHNNAHYTEWNFSPSLDWCCYEFEEYRGTPKKVQMITPKITSTQKGLEIILPTKLDIASFNLTGVLKTKKNETHYLALKHPKEKADFHFQKVWQKI
jgi:hypothetical protein